MFKQNTIKTAVMTAALAFAPAALLAADDAAKSTAQPQAGQSTIGQSDAAATTAGARSQSDRSSSRIGQGTFNEQKYVQKTREGNQFEIQLGQLAQQRAQSEEVKQLAQMLVQDHQQANQMLMQATSGAGAADQKEAAGAAAGQGAAQASGGSSGDAQLGPVHQAMLAEMQQLQGAEFDKAFVYGQLGGHIKSILWNREASTQAQSPQVKQYAAQSLPKLQSHLQQLQQLAGWDEATTAGASIHGDHSTVGKSSENQADDKAGSNRQEVKGALGGTNGTATDRNAASGGASTGQQSR